MQTHSESFLRQFSYHWKVLRKSDPRLARELGLTLSEVQQIKRMLINNSNSNLFIKEDEKSRQRAEYALPLQAHERKTQKMPINSEESKKNSSPPSKGVFAAVYSGLAESTAKVSKEFISKVSGLILEDDVNVEQKQQPKDQVYYLPKRVKETTKESDLQDMLLENEADRGSDSDISHTSEVLHKIQEKVEKVEQEEELEKRFSAMTKKVFHENNANAMVKESVKYEYEKTENKQVVFNSALDEVLYTQALKKLLHDRKEIRCKGIMEIEEIGQKNRAVAYALYPIVQDDEPDVRAQALISLINLNNKESIYLFKAALNDENARVRMAAIRGLQKLTGKSTSQFLSLALNDESAEVREITARYIGVNGDSASISAIIELLGKEREPSVRKTLLKTVTTMREKSTIPCIISMLNDPDAEFRKIAAETLEGLVGKKFGFKPDGNYSEREKVIEEIKQWWIKEKEAFQIMPQSVNIEKQVQEKSMPDLLIKDEKENKKPTVGITIPVPDITTVEKISKSKETSNIQKTMKSGNPAPIEKKTKPIVSKQVNKIIHHVDHKKITEKDKRHASKKSLPEIKKEKSVNLHSGKRKLSIKLDAGALELN